jgi:flagellar basal-body rod modification protein FlgD
MTDITSPTAPAATTPRPTTPPAPPPAAPNGTISADFDVFLRMLTTQLKYQDPMNPMDSAEFASQLATFAGVEQQALGNDILTGMSAQMATTNMAEVAAWIGQEVRVSAPVLFDGQPVTVSPNPALTADAAALVVRDRDGKEIMRQTIPVSPDPIEWAGVTADGTPLPRGVYSFDVVSYSDGEEILATPAEVYARVVEVRSQNGVNTLLLGGGITVPASTVTAIRLTES